MINSKDITGIILAGGKSNRMGTDKGFLLFNEKPFIQYSIDALQALVSNIIIVSNDISYDALGYQRINDSQKDFGPVAGIYSGLKTSKTTYNIILSCDIPLIKPAILQILIDAVDDHSDVIQIVSDDKKMPLIALYKKQCVSHFHKAIQENQHKLQNVLVQCISKNVLLKKEDEQYTINVNTKKEFELIRDRKL